MTEFETLEVKIPKEVLLLMKKERFVQDMKLFTAMMLYEENLLSLGKAAELAGKTMDEFIEALSEHKIDIIRYSKEELAEEVRFLRSYK